jgi:hypothetical protein
MSARTPTLNAASSAVRLSRPPIPHEHGAWVILYAPLLITLAVVPPFRLAPSLLLLLAVTGLFLSREAAGLLIRRRGRAGTAFWLGVYLILALAGALPLFLVYHRLALLPVGALVVLLFALHARLLVWPARRRLDRSQWGEILAAGALALTAPAAYVVARGTLDSRAWVLWACCTLFFSSSIFFVKMLLGAGKVRGDFGWPERWRVGRDNLLYHLLLAVSVAALALLRGGESGVLAAVAYVPVLARAFKGWATLSNRLPPLKRVGAGETVYSLWFIGFIIAALLISR